MSFGSLRRRLTVRGAATSASPGHELRAVRRVRAPGRMAVCTESGAHWPINSPRTACNRHSPADTRAAVQVANETRN